MVQTQALYECITIKLKDDFKSFNPQECQLANGNITLQILADIRLNVAMLSLLLSFRI